MHSVAVSSFNGNFEQEATFYSKYCKLILMYVVQKEEHDYSDSRNDNLQINVQCTHLNSAGFPLQDIPAERFGEKLDPEFCIRNPSI